MNKDDILTLQQKALSTREHIIRMATKGGCFIGASLSCADILVYLYSNFLRISPETLNDSERDYLFLSKGHDVPALYGILAELDFFPVSRLENHLQTNDYIYWHPNRKIPGIEFHSGSLGHLLSVAMGVAYDCTLRGGDNKIVVIVGDGELNEGSMWEGLLVASALKLDNLIVVVDRNQFQANIRTEELIPLENLDAKFSAFGLSVTNVDGHDFSDLQRGFSSLSFASGKPNVVVAHTLRGKGLPSIEARADRWFCNFSQKEVDSLLEELHGFAKADLLSDVLMPR